jgi:Tetratricopeptide repeat
MEISKTVLGPGHPYTMTRMWNLSHTLNGLGRHAAALSMLEDCVQLRNQRLGPTHPDTVAATAQLEAWQKLFKHPSVQE